MRKVRLFIDGQWCDGEGGRELDVLDPATQKPVSRLCVAGPEDLARALDAADRGFRLWRESSAAERAKVLTHIATLLRERADIIAPVITAEQGKPIAQAKGEIAGTAGYFDAMAALAGDVRDRIVDEAGSGMRRVVRHVPVGPIYAVSPWNMPALLSGRKIAIALAAGCSIIIKPAEETPETAAHIINCCVDAGVPPGVVNMVGGVPAMISEILLSSPVIAKLSFTGSTAVGRMLAEKAAAHVIPVSLELGGHAPVIICGDVDIPSTVAALVQARHMNAGQSCMAPTRFFVDSGIFEVFARQYAAAVAKLSVGPGADPASAVGPLATSKRVQVMERLVADAVKACARLLCGGTAPPGPGNFFLPTVLADVPDTAAIMREEPFGPITPLVPFADDDDVIAKANATEYGLAAYVFAKDATRAQSLADRLTVGLVAINSTQIVSSNVPFGGVGRSGNGREGAMEGLLQALVTKTYSMPLTT